jgi:cobalt-zinc-cadmium efflux system protein
MAQNHHHPHMHIQEPVKNIRSAFMINLIFTIIEFAGGLLTNSVAILSDALHDFGDSISLGMSWYFQKISQKARDDNYSFGYKRFSVFGALINSVILIAGSVFILWEAIPRLINPQMPDAGGMLILAVLGVAFNGLAFFRVKKGESLNEKVVTLHLLEDVLGWLAVLIASIVMLFFEWPVLDPILSLLIAGYILFNTFKNTNQALKIVLQGTPQNFDISHIENKVKQIEEIQSVHDIHLWSMDGFYNILTIHIVLNSNEDLYAVSEIKRKIRQNLKQENIQHITMEFENAGEECLQNDC